MAYPFLSSEDATFDSAALHPGSDPREGSTDEETGSDVAQCRTFDSTTGAWSPDTCPHAGGLDQNIYGASAP